MSQNINVWTLPTAAQVLSDIRTELSQGVSLCIVVAMPGNIVEFEKALRYDLEVRDSLVASSLHLPDLETVNLAGVQRAITGEEYESVSLEQFIQSETTPNVILIQGFDEITASLQKDTMSLLRRWVDYCHATAEKKSLCLIVPGNLADKIHEIQSSTTSSRLKIRCLVGIPSALEIQLIGRAQSGAEFISAEAHWTEFLVSSLSGNDLDMAYLLCQSKLNTLDDIIQVLKEYAESNSWERSAFEKELREWVPLVSGMRAEIPQHMYNMKLLWRQMTVYTPEYGEEIHPAGLALLGKYDEIKHRLWRFQATLVLPIIDELRIKIFFLLKNKLAGTWDHLEIPEIGELKFSLDKLPVDSSERKQFYEIVRHARDIRNKLAHIEIITLREYILLWNSWQKIRQMNIPNEHTK
jgi:hypothetical protein